MDPANATNLGVDVNQIDLLCSAFYGGNSDQQKQAHQVLLPIVSHPAHIPELQCVMANSQSPHSLLFASAGVTNLLTSNWLQVSDQQKSETRQFLLGYTYAQAEYLIRSAPEVLGQFIRLLARIVKLSWLENLANQRIVEQITIFLHGSTFQWVVGLQIFNSITIEMQPKGGTNFARNRRTAHVFRDTALPEIFQITIQTLRQFHSGTIHVPDGEAEVKLFAQVLQLALNCLSFDFSGNMSDDSTDDQLTVMLPYTWSILREESIPKLFFELYIKSCEASPARMDSAVYCLQCLVLLASIRRSFFLQELHRHNHIARLISGTTEILRAKVGLQEERCVHEMCRLIGKINTANQLSDMCNNEQFAEWIKELYQFSMQCLEDWMSLPNSKHYLLNVWASMVSPMQILKDRVPSEMQEYIYQITMKFFESRLRIAEAVAREEIDESDNPFKNEVLRLEQLELMGQLSKWRYNEVCSTALDVFEKTLQPTHSLVENLVREQKLICLVYIIGTLIGSHAQVAIPTAKGGDSVDLETITGNLAKAVFQLMQTLEGCANWEDMEMAFLYFIEQFRRLYIEEHARGMADDEVGKLSLALGVSDDNDVLELLIQKIFKNLGNQNISECILKKTLTILHDLVCNVNIVHFCDRSPHLIVSGHLLLNNKTIQWLLSEHTTLLNGPIDTIRHGKFRTMYYSTLGKLLFMEVKQNNSRFGHFMEPLQLVATQLISKTAELGGIETPCPESREMEWKNAMGVEWKNAFLCLVRDLSGLCQACNTNESYTLLFNWLVDQPKCLVRSRIHLFTWAVDILWDDSTIIIPLLKFISEFVYNKANRINFDQSSANGILLFKEASTILLNYGNRLIKRTQFNDVYHEKYKGIAIALELFNHTLSGNYVNFGVFELYQDQSFDRALSLAFEICLAIPENDLTAYLKTFTPFYGFLDLATKSFIVQLMRIPPINIARLLRIVEEGLCSFESNISMQACSIVDSFVTYFYTMKDNGDSDGQNVRNFLSSESSTCLPRTLQLMFQLVMTGEFTSTWSMSRPILGLILLYPDEYRSIKDQLTSQISAERQKRLVEHFEALMDGIEKDVSAKNKELFTKNLYHFSQQLKNSMV